MKNYVRLFGLAQTFVLFLSFSNSYAVARPNITPGMRRKIIEVFKQTVIPAGVGAAGAIGVNGVNGNEATLENSGEPYTLFWYVPMQDGLTYKVCQDAQNGRYISEPYWCP